MCYCVHQTCKRKLNGWSLSHSIDTLYTKHPITGEITTHTRPFPNLPQFSVTVAHPALLTLQATSFADCIARYECPASLRKLLEIMAKPLHPTFVIDRFLYWRKDIAASGPVSCTAGTKDTVSRDADVKRKRTCLSSKNERPLRRARKIPSSPSQDHSPRPDPVQEEGQCTRYLHPSRRVPLQDAQPRKVE